MHARNPCFLMSRNKVNFLTSQHCINIGRQNKFSSLTPTSLVETSRTMTMTMTMMTTTTTTWWLRYATRRLWWCARPKKWVRSNIQAKIYSLHVGGDRETKLWNNSITVCMAIHLNFWSTHSCVTPHNPNWKTWEQLDLFLCSVLPVLKNIQVSNCKTSWNALFDVPFLRLDVCSLKGWSVQQFDQSFSFYVNLQLIKHVTKPLLKAYAQPDCETRPKMTRAYRS